MSPIWSPEAIADLTTLRAYIAADNPAAAQRIALHIIHNVEELLSANPDMGRPGRVPGTRELVIPKTPFIVPYRVRADTVQILRVFHGARRWPVPGFDRDKARRAVAGILEAGRGVTLGGLKIKDLINEGRR